MYSEQQAGKNLLLELPEITLLIRLICQQAHEGEYASLEGLMNTKDSDILQKPDDTELMNTLELFFISASTKSFIQKSLN